MNKSKGERTREKRQRNDKTARKQDKEWQS